MSKNESQEYINLEFGYVPSSPNYSLAVELAENMSTYVTQGSGRQMRHTVALSETEADKWLQLYEVVKNWKSLRIFKGDIVASRRGAQSAARCYIERMNSEDKDAYCYGGNWIGCRKVREGYLLELNYGVGRFLGKDKFEPNKEEIRHRVEKGIEEYSYRICPAFSREKIFKEIDKLPSVIELRDNPDWQPLAQPEYGSDVIRLTSIEYGLKREIPKGPIIEGDDELLGDYSIRPRSGQNIWEHKFIVLSHDEWMEGVQTGSISKVFELGQMGWMLVNVVRVKDEWHCVFQRIA